MNEVLSYLASRNLIHSVILEQRVERLRFWGNIKTGQRPRFICFCRGICRIYHGLCLFHHGICLFDHSLCPAYHGVLPLLYRSCSLTAVSVIWPQRQQLLLARKTSLHQNHLLQNREIPSRNTAPFSHAFENGFSV
jgi:hypothetical protein